MSIEIESACYCDGPCGTSIRKGESCYCEDCYSLLSKTVGNLINEIQELERKLAILMKIHP